MPASLQDYVHEDIEVMKAELQQWKMEYKKRVQALDRERANTEEELRPFQRQLAEADEELRAQAARTHAIKANIAKNDARIKELLQMVVSN